MSKGKLLCALMAMVCLVESSLLDLGTGTEAFTEFTLSPPGSFATPPVPNSKEIISDDPDDVSFLLYSSPDYPNVYNEIVYEDAESVSKLNKSKPVKFIIHGFFQNGTTNFPRIVKDAYLEAFGQAYNIIVVEWSRLATPNIEVPLGLLLYPLAVANVEIAGVRLGEFIAWLKNLDKLDHRTTHIVGHSLGAHVAGWAGDTFSQLTGCKLARLSGLDPAGPLFEPELTARVMLPTDADFVDCYHTGKGVLGIAHDTGTVDFWINNGGPIQLRCLPDIGGFCSHQFSCEVWRQSIVNSGSTTGSTQLACRSNNLFAFLPSDRCEIVGFGEWATSGTQGAYFVTM